MMVLHSRLYPPRLLRSFAYGVVSPRPRRHGSPSDFHPARESAGVSNNLMGCPQIVYTDLNGLWLMGEWHEVKLKYTAVSMLCVPLSMIGVVTGKLGLACDGVGFDPFRSNCQKAAQGMNPSNYR
jgi:hypothetical protein